MDKKNSGFSIGLLFVVLMMQADDIKIEGRDIRTATKRVQYLCIYSSC